MSEHPTSMSLDTEGLDSQEAANLNNTGIDLIKEGRGTEAESYFLRAIEINPQYAIAFNNLGTVQAALGRYNSAIESYRQAIAYAGQFAGASKNLGRSLQALGRNEEAVLSFRDALAADPENQAASVNLIRALTQLGRKDEASAQCRVMGEWDHLGLYSCLFLAGVFHGAHSPVEACRMYERAIEVDPCCADAYAGLAAVWQELGDLAKVQDLLRRAIALSPKTPGYYRGLVLNAPIAVADPCFVQLNLLRDELPTMTDADKVQLHFALGKALSDVGSEEEGFRHLLEGNALKRSSIVYDEARELAKFQDIAAVFDDALMAGTPLFQSQFEMPVFIVGMPRSGSTLIEQILASHPLVVAGGELRELEESIDEVARMAGACSLAGLARWWKESDLRNIAARYSSHLTNLVSQDEGRLKALRVTDKRLNNFLLVGLIRLLFPRARIIHACRDPVDTCLSCFSLLFEEAEFSYDLGELGRRYAAYRSLMAHWRRVLPPGVMLDIQYEDVVADVEVQARRIVDHCGLPWDSACLKFHENTRPVRTASVAQVRQPIYANSINRWRPNEAMMEPLLQALAS